MSAVTASNAATAANGSSSNINAASTSAVAPANNNNGATKPAVQPSEVGWLFVTQYYTFLNQNPARLHCFFTKKSTMVHGTEQEESSPCFGQQQIHDKITSLNFQDAKVFVSNVDSQSSASGGILVQVLGELSNNGGAWRKFAQTFFLAEQPNGYFVLNDIFRYLKDEDEIEAEAEALDEAIQDEFDEADKNGVEVPHHIEVNNIGNANAMPKLPSSSTAAASGAKAIESAESKSSTAAASVAQAESAHTSAAPAPVDQAVATPSKAEPTQADADQVGVDKKVTVVDADQAPVAAAPAAAKGGAAKDAAAAAKTETAPASAAAAAQPTGPPKPKTWATLAASDATRWGSNVSTEAKGVSSSRPTPAASTPAKPAAAGGARPAAAAAAGAASPSVYIKNVVADQVNDASLRQALEAFGTVKDLQIIAQRSCAFAEFTSVDGARKAAAKGSVAVGKNGWNVQIEERRKNAAAGAGAGGAGGRGGAAVRGGAGAGRGGAGGAGGRGGAQRGGSGRPSAGGAPRAGAN